MVKISINQKRKEMHKMIRQEVIGVMREVFSDPEIGLELTPAFIKSLKKSLKDKQTGKTTPLSALLSD